MEVDLNTLYTLYRSKCRDEDVIQEAVIRAWQASQGKREIAAPTSYVLGILWHARMDGFRATKAIQRRMARIPASLPTYKQGGHRRVAPDSPTPLRVAIAREALERADPRLLVDELGGASLTKIQRFRLRARRGAQ